MPDGPVSVVIPTYRRPHLVIRAVRAALDDPAVGEVLVVLDGFDAETHTRLGELRRRDERIRIVTLDRNCGQGRARTAGAVAATRELLLLLDDDVIATSGLATGHLRAHTAADNLVVLGYMPTVPPETRRLSAVATMVYGHGYEIACRRYRANPDAVLDHLWGGNFSVRRTAYLAVSDELDRFPRLPGEDRDLGLRLRRAGLRGLFDPSLLAFHHHTRSWAAMLTEAARMGACDRALHALHRETLGPLDPDQTPSYLPAALQLLLRASDAPAVRSLELGTLHAAAGMAATVGASQTARRCAFLATQVANRCGRRTLSWRDTRLPSADDVVAGAG